MVGCGTDRRNGAIDMIKNIKKHASLALNNNRTSAVWTLITLLLVAGFVWLLDAITFMILGYRFTITSAGISYSDNFFNNPLAIAISVAILIVAIVLIVPLICGIQEWYLSLTDKKRLPVSHIFRPYENGTSIRSIVVFLATFLKMAIMLAILAIIPVALVVLANSNILTANLSYDLVQPIKTIMIIVAVVIGAVALVIFGAWANRYALINMLISNKYNLSISRATKQSIRCTRNKRWQMLLIDISYLPWFIPSALMGVIVYLSELYAEPYITFNIGVYFWSMVMIMTTLFIGAWILPHYIMTKTLYMRYIYEKNLSVKSEAVSEMQQATEEKATETPQPSTAYSTAPVAVETPQPNTAYNTAPVATERAQDDNFTN